MIEYSIYLGDYYSKQSIDWILCSVFANKPFFLDILIKMINLDDLDVSLQTDSFQEISSINKNYPDEIPDLDKSIEINKT